MAEKTKEKKVFTDALLKEAQKENYTFVKKRIQELQKTRKNHYGHDLDALWADADRDYIPHRLKTKTKRVVATDETKGWRGSLVNLGSSDWQSDVSQSNVFVKTQIALSILIDQNPSGVFTATNRKYQATSEIIKQLYQRSWEYAKSKSQLKLFVFNLAKYGWAAARTFPLKITRKVKVLKQYNADNPDESVYEEKEVVEYNDIMRENLDTRNVWIDDMAKPNNSFSVNDWVWRKVYDMDKAKEEFGKYKFWEYVQEGGNTQEVVGAQENASAEKPQEAKKLVEFYFYENRQKDLFMVLVGGAEGVPIIIDPLPISDAKGLKKLSLWQTYWNLRHAESPYGVGIYEAIRYDQAILDRFQNMTIDQITLAIYKMFFYQGTNNLSDTGDIKITPGVGRQVLDPKNISWLEVPGPGQDAYLGIEMFRKNVDEASGITDPLIGQVTGKTAFEIAQAKESALKRMKNPLDNILDALNDEGYITISLIQLLYSIPEVYEISDPHLIEDYLKEIEGDQELFERNPMMGEDGTPMVDEMGQEMSTFNAKVYREFPLNLGKDEKGNLIETGETQFFRAKPSALNWEGVINIKAQSLLSPSKQVDKALELEMYNMLIPLMQTTAQEYMLQKQMGAPVSLDDLSNGKVVKAIIKLYDKDPRDIIPDPWLMPKEMQPSPLFVPAMGMGQGQSAGQPGQPMGQAQEPKAAQAPTMVSSTQPPQNPPSLVQKISSGMSRFFGG